ncbi:Uncharacterised protein [Chryseobacterium nakagawai]|uniref:Uncharacterized protein n=1 Tax=Chryseobacterium nakagawai TaxID=1241982 RepID=A0AAD0YQ69_CHRNA|nr:hypothetical protein [Chryseobacterium nakagawai]AZA93040.1 hypothetical protein EG343_21770 [Chryseobacterium nakagawai]VEH19673.1 Uncharacterised protein [Chryseobacterium nakagawai]
MEGQKTITPVRALEIMREMSRQGIPFNFKYLSYNETEKKSDGFKSEEKIFLAQGYRRNQSNKHEVLVSFVRISGERRQFYYPLLIEFNGIKVKA